MDLLSTVEPQLAIPVVGAVVCAVLVYIFGFQETKEPSFEHVAVLHSKSKKESVSNSTRQRAPTSPQAKTSVKSKVSPAAAEKSSPKEKRSPKENAVSKDSSSKQKSSPKANGGPASPAKGKSIPSPKENSKGSSSKKTKQATGPAPAEDLGGGWTTIPRKAKAKNEKSKKNQD